MKTVKEQVLEKLKEDRELNGMLGETYVLPLLKAIDLTEQITRKECEEAIHIEVCRGYKNGTYKLRIGDVSGSTEMSNIEFREVINEIEETLKKEF